MTFDWNKYENPEEEETQKDQSSFDWNAYEEGRPEEVQKSLIDKFSEGVKYESAAGKVGQVVHGDTDINAPENISMGEELVQFAGGQIGDAPFMAVGGVLGGMLGAAAGSVVPGLGTVLGATVGSMFGAGALPAFLKQAVTEYQDFQNEGNDLTFGEFLQRADKVASSTLNGGLFGIILGSIGKGMGILTKTPFLKNMFDAKYVGKVAEKATHIVGMGVGGTAVGAAVQGEVPTATDFAKNLMAAAGFELASAAPEVVSEAINTYKNYKGSPEYFWKSKDGKALKQKILEEGVNKTSRETQETALKILQEHESAQPKTEGPESATKGIVPTTQETLPEGFGDRRITNRSTRISKQPAEVQQQIKDTGNIMSEKAFRSDYEAGKTIQQTIKTASIKEHKKVNEAYTKAKNTYEGYDDIQAPLAGYLEEQISKLETTLEPSPGERKALSIYKNLLNKLAVNGDTAAGYTPVGVDQLIKTSDSIASTLSYGTTEPDAKNILKGLPRKINEAARDTLKRNGVDTKSLDAADTAYGEWANKYINEEISPYFETREVNQEELFKLSKKEKQYRSIEEALPEGKDKTTVISKLARDIIEERLSPYYGKPEKIGTTEYIREINNLKDLIGTDKENIAKIEKVDKYLRKTAEEIQLKKPTAQEETIKKTKTPREAIPLKEDKITAYTKKVESVAKWAKMKPEDVSRKMNTRSGIKELRNDLSKTKGGDKIFESLKNEKARDILNQNKMSKDSSINDLIDVFNDKKNYEILEELHGKEELELIVKEVKRISNKEQRIKSAKKAFVEISKSGSKAASVGIGYFLGTSLYRFFFGGSEEKE